MVENLGPLNFLLWLKERSTHPERMDDFESGQEELTFTLRHFKTILRLFSAAPSLFRKRILPDILRTGLQQVTLLDVGAGSGDFALFMVAECKKLGMEVSVIGLDHDPRVVAFAQERVRHEPCIQVVQGDLRNLRALNLKPHFIVMGNTLHHLKDEEIPAFLRDAASMASHGLLVVDLVRSPLYYAGYTAIAALLFRRGFTYEDGRISIAKGFTRKEISRLVKSSGMGGALQVGTRFPGNVYLYARFL